MDVGDGIIVENSRWSFAGNTVKDFDAHISKSVPLYEHAHHLTLELSDFFVKSNSCSYDLGCSTGTFTRNLFKRHSQKSNLRVVGIDTVDEMIDRARLCAEDHLEGLSFVVDDIIEMLFDKSCLITSFYTMQFIDPQYRQLVFDKIYHSLGWGGAFIMFEKVRAPDARFQDIMGQIYSEHKLSCGYSASEIMAKSKSLKGVLEPFSTQGNLDLLTRAGFSDTMTVFKYGSFEGFLSIK